MQQAGVIERDGFALGYQVLGQGLPTLVIGSARYYARVFDSNLQAHLQLVCMDHRGFATGPHGFEPAACTLPVLVDDVEALRQHLGLGRVIILGHSGHGYMALEYAKAYPQHVSHVVLVGTGPDHSAASHAAADRALEESVCPERKALLATQLANLPAALAAAPHRRFATLCVKLGPRSWYDPAYDAAWLWEGVPLNMPILDHVWGVLLRDIQVTAGLQALQAPVLLALGRHDFLVAPPHVWDPYRAHFANLTVRIFAKSGHLPPLEEPALFTAELVQWLQAPQAAHRAAPLAAAF